MKITLLGTSHGDPTVSRLQSASLVEVAGKRYLIDGGEGISTTLIRRKTGPETIDAIFVTHMHLDHSGGIPELLELALKYRNRQPNINPPVFLPEARGAAALKEWLAVNYMHNPEANELNIYKAGIIFDDGVVKVEAFPTKHIKGNINSQEPRSFGFKITAEGKSVFFTGDLSSDFSDFPFEGAQNCELLISELVHFSAESAHDRLKDIDVGHLVFNHLGNRWQTNEGEKEILNLFADCNYPVTVGFDGAEFNL